MRKRTKYRIGAALFVVALIFVASFGAFTGIQVCKYHCQPDALDQRTADDRIADYTRGLEWFTAVLAGISLATLIFVIRADGTARRSADAALKAANALNLIERAYVLAKVRLKSPLISNPSGAVNELTVSFPNRGRTPAMITKIRVYVLIQDEPPRELLEIFPGSDQALPQGLAIALILCSIFQLPREFLTTSIGRLKEQLRSSTASGESSTTTCWAIIERPAFAGSITVGGRARVPSKSRSARN